MTETEPSSTIPKWKIYCLQILLDILRHPIEYAKVLIQIGYEPMPPAFSNTLFGDPVLTYPSVFAYISHIKKTDGVLGCYKGLWLKLTGNLLAAITTDSLSTCLITKRKRTAQAHRGGGHCETIDNNNNNNNVAVSNSQSENQLNLFLEELKSDVIVLTTAIVVSEPFHLITVRRMGQFIGKETDYDGLMNSIGTVYAKSGVLGFWTGCVPRLLGELLNLILVSVFVWLINKYLLREDIGLRRYTKSAVNVFTESIMYPFKVVSKCMSVTNSGLKAGSPPFMPHYANWIECWVDLSKSGQLKRGGSLFFRYAGNRNEVVYK